MLTKPRTVWACQPVSSMISASVAPWGPAHPIDHFGLFAPLAGDVLGGSARCVASFPLPRVLLRLPLGGRYSFRRLRNVRQQRLDRLPNACHSYLAIRQFLYGLERRERCDPGELFQISTGRFAGHAAISLASSWAELKYSAL